MFKYIKLFLISVLYNGITVYNFIFLKNLVLALLSNNFYDNTLTITNQYVCLFIAINLLKIILKYKFSKTIIDTYKIIPQVVHSVIHDGNVAQRQKNINSINASIINFYLVLPSFFAFIVYYQYLIFNLKNINMYIWASTIIFLNATYFAKILKQKIIDASHKYDIKNIINEVSQNKMVVLINKTENKEIIRISQNYNEIIKNNSLVSAINDIFAKYTKILFSFIATLMLFPRVGSSYYYPATSVSCQSQVTNLFVNDIYLLLCTYIYYEIISRLNDIVLPDLKILPNVTKHIVMKNKKYVINSNVGGKIVNSNNLNNLNNPNIISFNNVSHSYNDVSNVIENISFDIKRAKINMIIGENGSGKSTIMKLLLQLITLQSGTILYEGEKLSCNIDLLLKNISYITDDPIIFNNTIHYNIVYGLENVDEADILKWCEFLDLTKWYLESKNKVTYDKHIISKGDRKKIQLINALCKRPQIFIFDEPSTALDTNALKWFGEFIIKINNMGCTVIIVTHDKRLTVYAEHIINLHTNIL